MTKQLLGLCGNQQFDVTPSFPVSFKDCRRGARFTNLQIQQLDSISMLHGRRFMSLQGKEAGQGSH
jgi:hypothetical protein